MTCRQTPKGAALVAELQQFHGTSAYHKYSMLSKSVLTDGTKFLADKARMYWFFDLIDSYSEACKGEDFLSSRLIVHDNGEADAIITDGNDQVLAAQRVSFTDCELGTVKVFSARSEQNTWVHMLPGEY